MPSLRILDYIANNKCTWCTLILLQLPSIVWDPNFYWPISGVIVCKLFLLGIFEQEKVLTKLNQSLYVVLNSSLAHFVSLSLPLLLSLSPCVCVCVY